MKNEIIGIFGVVEIIGGIFLLSASSYAMFQWFGVVGVVLIFVYSLIMFIIMGRVIESNRHKRQSKDEDENNSSSYKIDILNQLKYDEEALKWMTVGYEMPLTVLILIYAFLNIDFGIFFIIIYLFLSISWTKLHLGHSVFDRIAAHRVLRMDINKLEFKNENLSNEISGLQDVVKRLHEDIDDLKRKS